VEPVADILLGIVSGKVVLRDQLGLRQVDGDGAAAVGVDAQIEGEEPLDLPVTAAETLAAARAAGEV
jgi:hypothetical protein